MILETLAVIRTMSRNILALQSCKVHCLVQGPTNLGIERGPIECVRERPCHRETSTSGEHCECGTSWDNCDASWILQRLQDRLDERHWMLNHADANAENALSPSGMFDQVCYEQVRHCWC